MSDIENERLILDEEPSLTGSAGALPPRIHLADGGDEGSIEKRSAGALAPRPDPPEPPPPPPDPPPANK